MLREITLYFDGGKNANGPYGSFEIVDGKEKYVSRLRFKPPKTSNEAEYLSLITGLRSLNAHLAHIGVPPSHTRVQCFGDSLLVVQQINGRWRCRDKRMLALCQQACHLLNQYAADSAVKWTARCHSVQRFGH